MSNRLRLALVTAVGLSLVYGTARTLNFAHGALYTTVGDLQTWVQNYASPRVLEAQGFRIVARRWKSPVGEIDIVARRRGTLDGLGVHAAGRGARHDAGAAGLARRRPAGRGERPAGDLRRASGAGAQEGIR